MKTIIAATDFSPASGAALRETTKLARSLNARILLVFVQNTTDIRYALQQEIPIEYQNSVELKKELARYLDKMFDSFTRKYAGNYIKIKKIVLRGLPWEEIAQIARKRKANMVVVGSRGLSPLKTFFVGSTTQNLIRACSCPVVVVHKPKRLLWKQKVA